MWECPNSLRWKNSSLLASFILQILSNARQACQHDIANNLHALWRNFVQRVISFMPIGIPVELDQIYRIHAGPQKGFMVIATNAFRTIDKNLTVPEFASRAPNNILQPSRAHCVTAQFKIFISHHIQKYQRPDPAEFVVLA